jgi:hypothetical protein
VSDFKTEEPPTPSSGEKEDHWAHYRSIQLTPEQKAEGRARLQKDIDRARADGVYERLIEWEERRFEDRAKTRTEDPVEQTETSEERWARYDRMKLTPEQVAEGRARLQKDIDRARAAGVYEGLLKWEGKVHWDIDIDELRKDREFD